MWMEQLEPVPRHFAERIVLAGAGLYVGDIFFGLVDDDMLFLKSDRSDPGGLPLTRIEPVVAAGHGAHLRLPLLPFRSPRRL